MDEHFDLDGIQFRWSRSKARENYRKHGIRFEQAIEAFFDPFLVVVDASPQHESRAAVIGMDESWNLLFVVHSSVEEQSIRIISARKATRHERRAYEN